MLKNKPSLSKIGVATAENEPIFSRIQWNSMLNFEISILSLQITFIRDRGALREVATGFSRETAREELKRIDARFPHNRWHG